MAERKKRKSKIKEAASTEAGHGMAFDSREKLAKGMVYVEQGVTKNLGDYNSARVTIGTSLPINYTDEDLEKARKAIKVVCTLVDDEIEDQMTELGLD